MKYTFECWNEGWPSAVQITVTANSRSDALSKVKKYITRDHYDLLYTKETN